MEYFAQLRSLQWIYLLLLHTVDALDSFTAEGCYNNIGGLLSPTCPSGEVIYPYDVYTYTKPVASDCMSAIGIVVGDPATCCHYVNETEDCGMRYYGVDNLEHYRKFTGTSSSVQLQVAWNDTRSICNQTEFYHRTHYMKMDYNCIKTSQIMSMCNSSNTGNQLFLWNDGYPQSEGDCGATSGCSCSVQASGGSLIQIDALDIRFATNETTSLCSQRVAIIDGSLQSDIACDDVNLFKRRTLYTSVSSNIQLRYDNTYQGSSGNFWISVQATVDTETLTIACGELDTSNVEYNCGENFTILSPDIPETTESDTTMTTQVTTLSSDVPTTQYTTAIEDELTSTSSDITSETTVTSIFTTSIPSLLKQPSTESSSKSSLLGIIIGVVAGLVVAGLVGYTIYRKKMKGKMQVNPEDEYTDLFNDNGAITSRPPETYRTLPN